MAIFVQVEIDPSNPLRKYVHWRFVGATNPYPANVDIRDVTAVSPSPQVGWTANSDGTYSAPAAPAAPPAMANEAVSRADFKASTRTKALALLAENRVAEALAHLIKNGVL